MAESDDKSGWWRGMVKVADISLVLNHRFEVDKEGKVTDIPLSCIVT